LKTKYEQENWTLEQIRAKFGEGIQASIELFIEYDYPCKLETIKRLKQL
jgi:hypothetical protein